MNVEKLKTIRQAEKAAQDLIISTVETSHTMIREAQAQAVELTEAAKKEARENETKVLSDYKGKGETQAGTILSELDRELKSIDSSADSGETKAIDYLKGQMKVAYGNS